MKSISVKLKRATGHSAGAWLLSLLVLAFILVQLTPLYFMISNSLKTKDAYLQNAYNLPAHAYFGNYAKIITEFDFPRMFLNSFFLTIVSVLICGYLGALAAFAAGKFNFKGRSLVNIMILPLMSCGARLPIYALIIPAFFAEKYQAFTMWIIYLIGVLIALIAARIMKSTLFSGAGEVYLMELPPYRMPTLKSLMLHMWDRGRMYLQKAGTVIFAASVILYICNTFPEKKEFSQDYDAKIEAAVKAGSLSEPQLKAVADSGLLSAENLEKVKQEKTVPEDVAEELENSGKTLPAAVADAVQKSKNLKEEVESLENARSAEKMEYTISGRVGKAMEPFFKPLGFDWKISTATIGALAAKEVFVAQMGILYSEGEADEESDPLRSQLVKNYTPLQAFCIMLFCLLSIPCLATLAIIRRELNSWKMAIGEAIWLFMLAYVMTLLTYQIGSVLQIGTRMIGM